MSWILLSILAAIFWTTANIIDKHVISHELRDPLLATVINGITAFIIFSIVSFIYGNIRLPAISILIIIFAGLVYSLGILLAFVALQKGEVSRFVPILSTIPIFVLIFAYFFLNETFPLYIYVGIFLIVIGALLVSFERNAHKLSLGSGFLIAIGAAIFFAFRNILLKIVTLNESIWSVLFWLGLGAFLFSILIVIFHHPHLKKKARDGVQHLVFSRGIGIIGLLCFTWALSLGSVSLASAIVEIKPMLVFLTALIISKYYPKIIKEKISKKIIIQKAIAITLIIIGVLIIV